MYLIQINKGQNGTEIVAASDFEAEANRVRDIMNMSRYSDLAEVVQVPNARDMLNPAQPMDKDY